MANNGNEALKGLSLTLGRGVYEVVGAGNWVVPLHKRWDAPETWTYWFRMLREEHSAPSTYSSAFRPADLLDLPKLAQVLATTIVQDGCVEQQLKDDLACLASGLEWFLDLRSPDRGSPWVVVKRKPMEALIDYLWDKERQDFEAASADGRQGHIFRDLADLNGIIHVVPRTAEEYLEDEL